MRRMSPSQILSRIPQWGRIAFFMFVCGLCVGLLAGGMNFERLTNFALAEPRVLMTSPPIITENKAVLLSYEAVDSAGIDLVSLRITPRDSVQGWDNAPIDLPLVSKTARRIARTEFKDLTAHSLAGQKVTLQIVATNRAGEKTVSAGVPFTLPQRIFSNPIARVLIKERERLMLYPDSVPQREEAANVMASIAHQTATYNGDPVILMALRGGAVRLVLGRDRDVLDSVNDILWSAAARIEEGTKTPVKHTSRDLTRGS